MLWSAHIRVVLPPGSGSAGTTRASGLGGVCLGCLTTLRSPQSDYERCASTAEPATKKTQAILYVCNDDYLKYTKSDRCSKMSKLEIIYRTGDEISTALAFFLCIVSAVLHNFFHPCGPLISGLDFVLAVSLASR